MVEGASKLDAQWPVTGPDQILAKSPILAEGLSPARSLSLR